LFFQLFWQIAKTSINILMGMAHYKESQFHLFEHNFCGEQI
jgi:hypothetical protein